MNLLLCKLIKTMCLPSCLLRPLIFTLIWAHKSKNSALNCCCQTAKGSCRNKKSQLTQCDIYFITHFYQHIEANEIICKIKQKLCCCSDRQKSQTHFCFMLNFFLVKVPTLVRGGTSFLAAPSQREQCITVRWWAGHGHFFCFCLFFAHVKLMHEHYGVTLEVVVVVGTSSSLAKVC